MTCPSCKSTQRTFLTSTTTNFALGKTSRDQFLGELKKHPERYFPKGITEKYHCADCGANWERPYRFTPPEVPKTKELINKQIAALKKLLKSITNQKPPEKPVKEDKTKAELEAELAALKAKQDPEEPET